MHFTLQQLKLFESVARNKGYTAAAKEQYLTQPAVSIQIKRLETQIGVTLFEKVGKRVFLTPTGESVYEAAVDILSRIQGLKASLETLKGEVAGPLQLSGVTTTKYFFPRLLGAFLRKYPGVEPKLRFTNRRRVIERLNNNEDDFVIMGQIPEGLELEAYPFLKQNLVPIAPVGHPLSEKKDISLKRLMSERFLQREAGSGTRAAFDRLLKEHDLEVSPYMELGSAEAIKQGVMAELGLGVVSAHAVALEREAGKLAILDVQGFPIERTWYAVHLKGKTLSLTARTFLDFILEQNDAPPERRTQSYHSS